MSLARIDLESFDDAEPEPKKESADYLRGFGDGAASLEQRREAEINRAVTDVAAALQDLTFGFAEARLHILDRIRPLLAQIAESVLPDVLDSVFATHLTDTLLHYFEDASDVPVLIAVSPEILDATAEVLSSQSEKYKKQNSVELNESFDDCKYGLQPAVCDTCYYILKDKKDIQNTIYTTYNKVFRNEFSKHKSLDRLPVFSVRDIMFVGDKQFVLHQRQLLIEKLTEFLKKTGLNCSIEVADDPFFSTSLEKKLFQFQFESKYEILASIPYLNKRIAIGSINLHLDSFSSAFNFTSEGSEIYSGCIGIGFERLLLAFYSQFGNEVSKWPSSLLKLI